MYTDRYGNLQSWSSNTRDGSDDGDVGGVVDSGSDGGAGGGVKEGGEEGLVPAVLVRRGGKGRGVA